MPVRRPAKSRPDPRFPEPLPARREGELDGLPTEMIVNTALKDYAEREDFPFHVWVSIGFQANGSGLPTDKEARGLETVEDAVLAAVRKAGAGHFIGRTTWNGTREFNFYVEDPEAADERLETLGAGQARPFVYEICEDPAWQRVDFFFDYTV